MTRLFKFAANLKRKGFNKLAQEVNDLAKKEQDRLESIRTQHEQDKESLKNPERAVETAYPTEQYKRYDVEVVYPSFDEKGSPYFDKVSVSENLTMNEDDLLNYQEQENQGYVKITSVKPLVPKSSRH